MLKNIYLYNNFHLNKVSISFIILSTILILISVVSCIDIDLNSLEDLRNYEILKDIFIIDIYYILEIIISLFVIILSFMELYNNAHLFDVVLIAQQKKSKVLLAKLISYLIVIIIYITIVFLLVSIISVSGFRDIYILKDIFTLYMYSLLIGVLTLLLSIILLTLFKNYFASFILLLFVLIKRIFLETNNELLNNVIPYINISNISISIHPVLIIFYLCIVSIICFVIFYFKDIKT